ncbi:hypothetical protein HPP92_027792 [Vanilla planifolia]|uniref:Uncharacterized protein n=1 Tax=Vanilla planifolia TaxID=51239 RepID=A0A835P9R9_VANPL|nr:hypothetical protein HPP92_027792 [Vanilla planifolia]
MEVFSLASLFDRVVRGWYKSFAICLSCGMRRNRCLYLSSATQRRSFMELLLFLKYGLRLLVASRSVQECTPMFHALLNNLNLPMTILPSCNICGIKAFKLHTYL